MEGQSAHHPDCVDCARTPSALLYFMRQPIVARLLVALPLVLVAFFASGISLWRCPLMGATGCRCPGCGLTRSFAALGRGELPASFALHPFTVVFALGWALLAVHLVLTRDGQGRMERWIHRVEGTFPISTWLMMGFLVFGTARLVFDVCSAAGIV